MRRSTGFSAFFSLLRSGSAGAILLATILSCSDSTSPSKGLDGVIRVNVASVQIIVPDSLKQALAAENASMLLSAPAGVLANVVASPGAAFSASSCGSGDAFVGYTKSKVAFAPEAIPSNAPFPLYDEGFIPDKAVPLGFNFKFEGNTYDKVNVYFNGFLLFGPVPSLTKGYSDAGFIAATTLLTISSRCPGRTGTLVSPRTESGSKPVEARQIAVSFFSSTMFQSTTRLRDLGRSWELGG